MEGAVSEVIVHTAGKGAEATVSCIEQTGWKTGQMRL